MYEFEYNIIIDNISDRFSMDVDDVSRAKMINVYENVIAGLHYNIEFEVLCERIIIEAYLEQTYPGMGIFQRVFLTQNQN